ncbi:TRAP transporter substrate-binding protein [Halanaerobium sp. Z-7514]|uniref:TRAP transporter substrate-binding protein n=1 Tax=Halanaerobium polyolivorans TaxID=2886943 RepID=A0AAW4X1V0_9FIRM|nr:TRAP transporter substrate-binding protein [Halanaerobium polyolivorans]MCC3145780.1 TRAP transporter substrate-binding protein [Halanaerobium polyolivorans]
MKKSIVFLVLILLLSITGVHAEDGYNIDEEYSLRMANVIPERDHIGQACNKFAELVEEKTNGKIDVTVFHGGQLGSGRETYEAVQQSFIDIAGDSYANLYTLSPIFEAFHLPYMFESREQQLEAYQNEEIREYIDNELSKKNLKWLMTLEFGPRQIGTINDPVKSVSDLDGMQMRASRSPTEISTYEAWGASAVTIDWPEVPESLRLGMVDGEAVSYDAFWSANHHEGLINYITETNFQSYGYALVVNYDWWESLPENVQKALDSSAREAEKWHVNMLTEHVNMNIREMREEGVEIRQLPEEEYLRFKDKARDQVWDKFIGDTVNQEFLDLIQSEIGEPGPYEDRWYFEH